MGRGKRGRGIPLTALGMACWVGWWFGGVCFRRLLTVDMVDQSSTLIHA